MLNTIMYPYDCISHHFHGKLISYIYNVKNQLFCLPKDIYHLSIPIDATYNGKEIVSY